MVLEGESEAEEEATVTVATIVEGVKEDDMEGWHPLEVEEAEEDEESISWEDEAMLRLSSGEDELELRLSLSLGLRLMVLLFKLPLQSILSSKAVRDKGESTELVH